MTALWIAATCFLLGWNAHRAYLRYTALRGPERHHRDRAVTIPIKQYRTYVSPVPEWQHDMAFNGMIVRTRMDC